MMYNNVKERMKEIKKELSKDYRFYLYGLGGQVKEGGFMFIITAILGLIIIPFNTPIGLLLMIVSILIFVRFLYDANRFQNIYEREKLKEEKK